MKKNRKFNTKEEKNVKMGRPWTVIADLPTYNEAIAKVEEEKEMGNNYDYKIKRHESKFFDESKFRVKKRLRSDLVEKKKK